MMRRVLVRWYSVDESAARLGVAAKTLRKRLERAARCANGGIEACSWDAIGCKLATHWRVTDGQRWLRVRQAYPIGEAAAILGMSTIALRKAIERNARRDTAVFDGIHAHKNRVGRWRVAFGERWTRRPEELARLQQARLDATIVVPSFGHTSNALGHGADSP